ncbi:winged helix-turn-helix transcriptional regulator [Catenulispora rubra]|uniref:winged helix-turn-helix transcriptional regulator n=1 Tax=Catenulispora rubra TaxID=280293 RepID=UPI001891F4F2|nr:helix-turn-helix domain-containing protein [Catenulispora rubra]
MPEYALTMSEAAAPRAEWCPISRSLDAVSQRSAFLVLREAFYGTTRFDDFATRVGVSEQIVAARLKSLVAEGLLGRRPYKEPGRRTRHEYHLTESGREFYPVIAPMFLWGSRWRGPAVAQLQHRDCGTPVRIVLECERDHGDLTVGDVEVSPAKQGSSTAPRS